MDMNRRMLLGTAGVVIGYSHSFEGFAGP